MKHIYVVIFILLSFNALATNYYVSSSGNDSNDGLTEATSWKTLAKVNANMNSFVPGDIISFNGSDRFYGTLSISNKNHLTFTSYGTGKAIITGSKEISGWTNSGGNIWVANTGNDKAHQVFKNGKVITLGRFPKIASSDRPDLSYFKVTSKDVGSKISFGASTAKGLDLKGATIHASSHSWRLDGRTITNYNSGTGAMTLSSGVTYNLGEGDRFFVNNHISLVTTQDEWYYGGGKLHIYSIAKPSGISINTENGSGVKLSNCSYINIENIIVRDYNHIGFELNSSNNVQLDKVDIKYAYYRGINLIGSNFFTLKNSSIEGANNVTVYIASSSEDASILNNEFYNNGVFENFTSKNTEESMSILSWGDRLTAKGNNVHNIGYSGFLIRGANSLIENNFIKDFAMALDDSAAFYTHNAKWSDEGSTGTIFRKNIAIGHDFSVRWYANGFYSDDRSHDVIWEYNTAIGTNFGMYFHNTANITFRYNNIYNTKMYGIYMQDDTIDDWKYNADMKNNNVTYNNIFMINQESQGRVALRIRSSWEDWDFGKIDFNKYYVPYYSESIGFTTSTIHGKGGTWDAIKYSLQDWKSSYGGNVGYDTSSEEDNLNWNSPEANSKSIIVYNTEKSPISKGLNGIWQDLEGNKYNGSVELDPYTSKILILSDDQTGFIAADAGTDQIICLGENAVLTASGGSRFSWNNGETTKSITVSPSSTETYTVTVSDGTISDTDDVMVTVNSVSVNAGSDVTINEGDETILTASGGDTYLWSTGETSQNITVNPTTTTTYTVKAYKNGCENSDNVIVNVNPKTGSINASAGSDVVICSGESITLTASGGTSYSWSTGETSKAITVNPGSTETYTVTVSDGSISDTDDVMVTVNSVSVNAGSDVTINEGDETILTASGGDTYLWSTGETSQNITVNPTTTTTYTVKAYENGCENSDNVIVNVNPKTGSIIANAGPDVLICSGESITLTASGGTSYSWSTGATTKSITVSPTSTETFIVTVSDGTISDTDDVMVTVNSVSANAGSDVTINEGDETILSANGGDSYLWSTGETTQNITVSPIVTTTYTVTINLNGCKDTDDVKVAVQAIELTNPLPTLLDAGDDVSICLGEFVTLSASGANTFQWSTGEFEESISVNPTRTTTYTVTTFNEGVAETDTVMVTVENCFNNTNEQTVSEMNMNIYPNPTEGELHIRINDLNEDSNIMINDPKGSLIYFDSIEHREDIIISRDLDLTSFSDGIYFVKLFNSEQSLVKKIIIL